MTNFADLDDGYENSAGEQEIALIIHLPELRKHVAWMLQSLHALRDHHLRLDDPAREDVQANFRHLLDLATHLHVVCRTATFVIDAQDVAMEEIEAAGKPGGPTVH